MADGVKLACATCGQMNRVPLAKLGAGPKCGSCGEPLVTGKVAELDITAHDKATRGDDLPLLVDYWAPWCGPCRMMAPEFAKAAKALGITVEIKESVHSGTLKAWLKDLYETHHQSMPKRDLEKIGGNVGITVRPKDREE